MKLAAFGWSLSLTRTTKQQGSLSLDGTRVQTEPRYGWHWHDDGDRTYQHWHNLSHDHNTAPRAAYPSVREQ